MLQRAAPIQTIGSTREWRASSPAPPCKSLFHFHGGAGVGKLLADVLRLFLADAFLNRLGRAVYQVLGFLQAEVGDLAHRLDHVDLVSAHVLEDDRELGLVLGRGSARRRARAAAGNDDRSRRRSRDAEALLKPL